MKRVMTIDALWTIFGSIVREEAQAYHQSFSGKENLTELMSEKESILYATGSNHPDRAGHIVHFLINRSTR